MKRTTPGHALVKALLAFAAMAAIILFLLWYTGHRRGDTSDTGEKFYRERVTPILDAQSSADAEALRTLKSGIHRQFRTYRQRVPAFTDDITGFGNKTKITWEAMKQMTSSDKEKVQRHVMEKFEMHVVSAKQMEKDLEVLLHAFRRDIEANRNRMLVDIEAAVRSEPGFEGKLTVTKEFTKRIEERIRKQSLQAGKDAVVLSGMTFLVSLAAEEAVRNLVVYALGRVGGSVAGGGTAGSLGGPAGAVIGVVVGLTVGIIVDVVMTDRMQERINDECAAFLIEAQRELTTKPDGLVSQLEQALKKMDQVTASSIKEQIKSLP